MKIELINEDAQESFEPRQLLLSVLRAWPLFAFCGALLLLLAGLFHTYFPPIHEAGISIHVENPNGRNNSSSLVVEPRLRTDLERNFYINEEVRIGSYGLMLQALKNLEHHVFYYKKELLYEHLYNASPIQVQVQNPLQLERGVVPYNEPIQVVLEKDRIRLICEGELANGKEWAINQVVDWGAWVAIGGAQVRIEKNERLASFDFSNAHFGFMLLDIEEQALEFSESVEVVQGKMDASVYDLSLSGGPEAFIIDVLDALALAYKSQEDVKRSEVHKQAVAHISTQLNLVKKELAASETAMQAYKSSNSITSLSHEGSLLLDQGFKIDGDISETKLKENYYVHLSELLKSGDENTEPISPEAFGIEDRLLSGLASEWITLLNEKRSLERQGNIANPSYQRAISELVDLKKQLAESLNGFRSSNNLKLAELNTLRAQNKREARQIPNKENVLLEFERVYRGQETHYQTLTSRLAEASIALEAMTGNVTILESAHLLNFDPFLPDPLITLVALVLLMLAIPAGYLVLRGIFGNKLISESQLVGFKDLKTIRTIDHHALNKAMDISSYPDSKYADDLQAIGAMLEDQSIRNALFVSVSASHTEQIVADLAVLLNNNDRNVEILDASLWPLRGSENGADLRLWLLPSIRKRASLHSLSPAMDTRLFICQRNKTTFSELDIVSTEIQSEGQRECLIYADSVDVDQKRGLWENEPRSAFWKFKRILKKT